MALSTVATVFMLGPFPMWTHLIMLRSDEEEKLWIWNYNGADMFMDLEEDVG